ncbi:MAG: peroxiredoxin family protein [Myxococcota bacterium]
MSELHGLQLRATDFEAAGAKLVAVSVDSVEQNRGVIEKLGLSFPLLSDPGFVAVDAFGLRHAGGNPFPEPPATTDIARPAIYVISGGTIRWRHLTDSYRVRANPDDVLAALR